MLVALVLTPVLLLADVLAHQPGRPPAPPPGRGRSGDRGRPRPRRGAHGRLHAAADVGGARRGGLRCPSACRSPPAARRATCSSPSTWSSAPARSPTRCRAWGATAPGEAEDRDEPPPGSAWSGCCSAPWPSTRCRTPTRRDFSKGLENVVFFYVPFALLFGLLAAAGLDARAAAHCARHRRGRGGAVQLASASSSTRPQAPAAQPQGRRRPTTTTTTSASTRSSSTRASTAASSPSSWCSSRRSSCGRASAARCGSAARRAGLAARRHRDELLAVEPRRAAARARRPGRLPLERARHGARLRGRGGGGRRRRPARALELPPRPRVQLALGQQRHQRARDARSPRRPELFAHRPLQGYGSGSFSHRLPAPLPRGRRRTPPPRPRTPSR